MKERNRIKGVLFFVSFVFLSLLPFFFCELSREKIIWNHIPSTAFFFLPLYFLVTSIQKKWVFAICSFLLFLVSSVEMTLVVLYESYVNAGNILAAITASATESSDFLGQVKGIIPYYVILLFSFLLSLSFYRPAVHRRGRMFIALLSCLLVFIYLGVQTHRARQTLRFYAVQNLWGRPPYNFWYQLYNVREQLRLRDMIAESKDFSFHATHEEKSEREIYVLAIGESCRYSNLHLGGYQRNTTPALDSLDNLMLFTDYFSTANLTMYSVPQILTRGTPSDYSLCYREKSIFAPFKECGFKTFVVQCKNLLGYETYLSDGVDSLISVPKDINIAAMVDSISSLYPKAFFIVQFFGNHNMYRNFEKEQDVFHPNPVSDDVDWSNMESMINAYDNTVLYTDYTLASLIKSIDKPNTQSTLIFVSDHGEDFRPGTGGHGGNSHPNKEEYHVPFIFWHSLTWEENYPDKKKQAELHKSSPINADNVFYSVCDMAAIQIAQEYSRPQWSVFSQSFFPHDRYLIVPDGVNKIKLQ